MGQKAPPWDGTKPGPGRPGGSRNKPVPPQQLKDMRHVYETEVPDKEFADDTPGQAAQRTLLRTDRAKFLTLLQKMESEHRGRWDKYKDMKSKAGQGEVAKGVSEDTQAITDVIDGLLSKWEGTDEGRG